MTGSDLTARLPALAAALVAIALLLCALGLSPHSTPVGSAAVGSAAVESPAIESAALESAAIGPSETRSIENGSAGSISPVESSDPCDPREHADCDSLGHTLSISTTPTTPLADLALVQSVAGAPTTAGRTAQVTPTPPTPIGLSVLRL